MNFRVNNLTLPSRKLALVTGLILTASVGLAGDAVDKDRTQSIHVIKPADLKPLAAKAPSVVAELYRELSELLTSADLASPVEKIALEKINRFLEGKETKELPILEKLEAAEKALLAVIWFHDGARPEEGRTEWGARLRDGLRDVRRQQLSQLFAGAQKDGAWTGTLKLADRLLTVYAEDSSLRQEIRIVWARHALAKLEAGDYSAARAGLTRIEAQFVHSPQADPIRQGLRKRAQMLVQEAQKHSDREAQEKLTAALALWPRLPGVRDSLLKLQKKYSVLYVGVRSLPEYLSPATAWTDSEKRAVELLFEALVRPDLKPAQGQTFRAQLAVGVPDLQTLQRRFLLRRDIYWSDGERLTSADIRHTVQLLQEAELAGRVPAWHDLFEIPRLERASFYIDFHLRQGLFEPLSLLSFQVLPQNYHNKPLKKADDPEFAKAPVGSGPFVYLGRRVEDGRELAVFAANPHFDRGQQQPFIREIRFFAWKDAKDLAFAKARSALLLDVPTEQIGSIQGLGTVRSFAEPRVYFLAVNQRVKALANLNLRRALAHAIDREKLLRPMRGGNPELDLLELAGAALAIKMLPLRQGNPDFHRAVNGPYPMNSWACAPAERVPLTLHDPARAKALFREVHKQLGDIKLTLKYPADDSRIARACQEMAAQVNRLAGSVGAMVQLQPVGLPARALKEAVERRDFDLAYYHQDYNDETYWLWPLFDPQPDAVRAGGSNFLGHDNDSKLQSLFRAALAHRQFSSIREITHNIHAHLFATMPLIPLWQLHAHVVVPAQLNTGDLEPGRGFSRAAEWKIAK